jgi:polyisoprenoid-binding protein YceI
MSQKLLSLTVATLLAGTAFAGDTYTVDKAHSEALFKVRHLVSKVSGRFGEFTGTIRIEPDKPEASSVEFAIKVASIDTDNEQRDQHLRSEDFFWADKHPEITFKSASIEAKGGDRYAVSGTLTMRGVAKQVTLPVTLLGFVKDPWGNEKVGFALETTLNRKDYGIVWNKALDQGGVLLGDEVEIEINLEATKN